MMLMLQDSNILCQDCDIPAISLPYSYAIIIGRKVALEPSV